MLSHLTLSLSRLSMVHQFKMKLLRSGDLNVLVYEDILLSINTKTAAEKVAFNLVNTCYFEDFPEGNCRLAWDHLHSEFEPNTAPSLLKLCKITANSKMDPADKDPDIWITNLEVLRQRKDEIGLVGRISAMESMIKVLSNLLKCMMLPWIAWKTCLASTGEDRLTLESLKIWKDYLKGKRKGSQWESFGNRIQCSVQWNM